MEISKDKKYTSNGRPVRIIATDAKGDFPIIGLVSHPLGAEDPISFTADGKFNTLGSDPRDLVEVKETVTRYFTIDQDHLGGWQTFNEAETQRESGETIVKVVFTPGEDQQ